MYFYTYLTHACAHACTVPVYIHLFLKNKKMVHSHVYIQHIQNQMNAHMHGCVSTRTCTEPLGLQSFVCQHCNPSEIVRRERRKKGEKVSSGKNGGGRQVREQNGQKMKTVCIAFPFPPVLISQLLTVSHPFLLCLIITVSLSSLTIGCLSFAQPLTFS